MATGSAARQIEAPWVWTPTVLSGQSDWVFPLDDAALLEIDRAYAHALDKLQGQKEKFAAVTAADFPLPTLSEKLRNISAELSDGRGLALLRGLPVEKYDRDELVIILWGLGSHLGVGISQSYRGDMIGDVMDMSHEGDIRRAYRSPRPLYLHVDPVDIVGLLCLRPSRTGGQSLIASGLAIHNAILNERPDLMPYLYRGYYYHHSEAESTGEPPTTSYRVPVFKEVGGRIVCNFNANTIGRSLAEDGLEHDPQAIEAFEIFKEVTQRDEIVHRINFEPGDLQLLNNRVMMHGRTEFDDWPEIERKRHLLRVWLMKPDWATGPDDMHWRPAGHRLRGVKPTSETA